VKWFVSAMKQFAVAFAMNKDKEKDYNLKKKKNQTNKQKS